MGWTMPTDALWLGQVLATESRMAHEWAAVAWVVRNRVESGSFGSGYEGVILRRKAFSFYNEWTLASDLGDLGADAIYALAGERLGGTPEQALQAAERVLAEPRIAAPFGPRVYNYYSPRSMIPPGSVPNWDWAILRPFSLGGIDPWRFVFAETVFRGHPLAGPPRRYTTDDREETDT